jgi:hypothetical protein
MSSLFLINVLEVFSKKRLKRLDETKSRTPNALMKSKLQLLAERLKNGTLTDNKLLLEDTSGPTMEDSIH